MASDPRHHYHHDSTTEKKNRTNRHSPSSSTSSDSDSDYSSSSTTSSSSSSYRRRSGDAAGASVSTRQGYGKKEDKKRTRSKGGSSRKGGSSTSGERPKSKKVKSSHKRSSSSKGHSSRKSHSSKKEYKDYEYTSSGSKIRSSSSSHHHHQGGSATAAAATATPSLSTSSHHHSHHHHHHHRSSKQASNGSTTANVAGASSSSSSYKRAGVRALSPPSAVGATSTVFVGGTTSSSSRKSRKSSPSGKSFRRKSSSRDRGGSSSAITASGDYRTVSLASSAFSTRGDESSRAAGSAVTSRRGLPTSPDRYGDVYDHHSNSPHHHTQQHHHHTLMEHQQQQHHHKSSSSSSKREHHSTSSPMHHHSANATAAAGSRQHHTFDDARTERDVYKALHRQNDPGDKGRGSKYSRGEHEFLRNHEVVLPSSRDDLERASSSELQQEYYEGKSGRERGSSYDRYSVGRSSSSRLDPSSYSPHSHAAAYDKHHDKYYDKYSDKYQAYEKSSSSFDKHQSAYDKNYDGKALSSSYDKGAYDKSLSHLCDKSYEKQELYDKSYHQHYEKRSKRETSYGEDERSAGRSHRGVAVGDHYSESMRDIASDPWHEDDLLQHDPLPHHLSSHHHHQRGGSSRSPPSSHRQPLPPSEHAIGGGGGGGIQSRLSDPAKIHSHHQQQQQPSSSQLPQSPHGLPPPPHHHPSHNQPPPGMQQHPSPLTQQQLQQPPPHPHHQPLGPPPPQMAQPPQMHPPPHQFGVPMNQGLLQGGGSVGGLGGPIAPPPSHQQQFNQPPPQSGPPNIRGGTLPGGPNIRGPSGGPGIPPGGPNSLRAPNVGPNIRGSLIPGGAMPGPSNVRGAPSGHNIRGPNGPPFRGRGEWMGGPPGRGAMHGGPPLQWDRNDEFGDEYGEGSWGGGDGSVNQGGEWADQSKRIMHPPPSGPHVSQEGGGWGPAARLGPRDGGMVRPPLGDQGPPHFLRPPPVNLSRPPPPTPTLPGMGGPGMARPSTLLPPHPPPARHPLGPGESPQKRLDSLQGGPQNVLLSGLGRGLSGRLGGPPNLSSPPPNMSKPPPATPMQLNKPPPQFIPKQHQHQQPLPPGDSPTGGNSPNDGSNGEREGECGAGNNDLLDDIEQLSDFSDDADDLLNRDAGGPVEEPPSAAVAATTVSGQGPATPAAALVKSQTTPSAGMNSAAADAQQLASPSASITAAGAACTAASITDLFEDEETMDLEEISDDDLEDERQAKFTVCDALTINWTALATAERPPAASSGGVMERFSAASILARIGVSSRYARPSVVGRVLSACGACPGLGLHTALPHCIVPQGGADGVENMETIEQQSTASTTIVNKVVKIEPDIGNLTDHKVPLTSEQPPAQVAVSTESGLETTPGSTRATVPADTDEVVDAATARDGGNNQVVLPTTHGSSANSNDYVNKETKKLMATVDAGGHGNPVLVPAVVCDSGVVSLLRFRPKPKLAVKHDADGLIDSKQLLEEEHDVPIVTHSEEILLLGPHSVALSAYQDIRIRQELCRTNTLGQLLTVHTLPHQRAC